MFWELVNRDWTILVSPLLFAFRFKSIRFSCSRPTITSNRKTSQMKKEHHQQSEKNNHATVLVRAVQFPLITKRRTQSTFVRCNKARPTWLGSTMEPDPCLLVIVTCICMYHVLRSVVQLSYQAPPNKSNSYGCTAVLRRWGTWGPKPKLWQIGRPVYHLHKRLLNLYSNMYYQILGQLYRTVGKGTKNRCIPNIIYV